jgi:hypothetical protein
MKKIVENDNKITGELLIWENHKKECIQYFLQKTVDILFPLVHNKGTFLYAFRIQHFKNFQRIMDI